ncbi:MAG: chromate efflux transporter [Gemmatimonadaceae bacterium]|nr:chromate efflux transporter [Gemmatimonadaceae bacterium]
MTTAHSAPQASVRDVAAVFVRLGVTAFGGPLAHIAAMEDELVTRRQWVSREEFADLVGAANLIPGPNSTELASHLGYRRAGWPGLVAAGVGFILPAVLLVWGLAVLYTRLGARVDVAAALSGMQPAVLAVVVQAAWRLKGSFVRSRLAAVLAGAALVAVLAGVSELTVLLAAVILAIAMIARTNTSALPVALSATGAAATTTLGTGTIFLSFAKIGSVLYGSGYVLLTFLRGEFGERLHVLTDALAVGQVTPGPVFSAATFVGYLLGGSAGAWAATAGIFLPAFVGVALTAPFVRRLRGDPRLAPALDVVNAVSLALMVSVVLVMARAVAAQPLALAIFLATSLLLLTTRVGAGWVLLLGGLAGLLRLL